MTIRTIKGRIVLAIVLVGCIPLVIGLVLASMSGMRSLRDVIGGNFQAIAEQAADRLTMLVQSQVQGVRLLASAPLRVRQPVEAANLSYPGEWTETQRLIQARAQEWEKGRESAARLLNSELSRFLLETKVRDGDKMVGLLITDRYGALVAASSEPDHYFLSQEPWWEALQSGGLDRVYVSGVIPGQEGSFRTPEETIDIAVPILDDHQHAIIGAIKASYRFDSLFAMIKEIRIGQTGHAMLFDAAGEPLVCPILPRRAHRIPSQLMAKIVSSDPGWEIAEDDGHGATDTVVGYAPVTGLNLPDTSWHVFVRQQPEETYAPIRDQLRNLALIGVVMLGLLWAMGRYVAARIARPIQVLKTGVEAISQGTYDGPLDIRTGDEFEELAVAVHRMADRLQASRGELETLNAELTHRVEEKTAEITRQMRKLELSERLATLGKVASGIAHEINNPLGIILNRIECMEAEAAQTQVPDDVSRDLVAIRTQAERISRVTRSILTFSRGTVSTLKPLDVNCVARTCVAMAGERVATLSVRIESHLSPELAPAMGDRDRLETVLLNLINNAIDAVVGFTNQGLVTLRTERLTVEGEDWVRISVSDNGPGVPSTILDRIFDPFFTTKPAGQGTGLGLFLSYGIVSDHRGRIEVRNESSGAAFDVYLPAVGCGAPAHEGVPWGLQEKF
ncbi:MAG: Adaptive-response sensory-kinase SasA [Nitrospirae bacterium]|nr:Adaptive-response sensory-kinase SasA [Nitrospirota bacterium]MCE7965417.1 HAMP domain-containing protein [Nitrospira sp. NTP2]MCK6493043.1 ATP-binding protein [Nitrospira sp.]MEB2338390.1 ATP-binding protein [Nitrospirales bacterium]QOJ36209.1 MAG: HAMP domain-containing protein [Nitrospira sp.]